jgi:hypothetical protein
LWVATWEIAAVDQVIGIVCSVGVGLVMLLRPEWVRRHLQKGQIFNWARRGYDRPFIIPFLRLLGLAFLAFGAFAAFVG